MRRLGAAWLLAGCSQGGLDPAGVEADRILTATWLLTIVGTIVTVAVLALLWWAIRRRGDPSPTRAENVPDRRLERRFVVVGGVIVPSVILAGSFVLHLVTVAAQATPVPTTVEVTGHRYWWEVVHPDLTGASGPVETANVVHVPVGRPVTLVLRSDDVIHSFWVPSLAGKMDLVPGRTNEFTLTAEEPGVYEGYCAEFCGLQHTWMKFEVVALADDDYDRWVDQVTRPAAEPTTDLAARGRDLFLGMSCAGCHAIGGVTEASPVPDLGPDLTHLASRDEIGAGVLPLSRDSLAAWIVNPQTIKPGAPMPPNELTPEQVDALVAYLLTLE